MLSPTQPTQNLGRINNLTCGYGILYIGSALGRLGRQRTHNSPSDWFDSSRAHLSYIVESLTGKVNYKLTTFLKYSVSLKNYSIYSSSLRGSANSKDEAIKKLSERLQAFFKDTEIIDLEIEIPQPEHPWLKFAGIFENDPQFDEFLQAIQDYRNEIDAEEE